MITHDNSNRRSPPSLRSLAATESRSVRDCFLTRASHHVSHRGGQAGYFDFQGQKLGRGRISRDWHDRCYLLYSDVYIQEMAGGRPGRAARCAPAPSCGGSVNGLAFIRCKVLYTHDLRRRPAMRPSGRLSRGRGRIAANGRCRRGTPAAKMAATRGSEMRDRQLSHGSDTDQTRIVFRVPSVFHPWLQPPFVSFACFVVPSSAPQNAAGRAKKVALRPCQK